MPTTDQALARVLRALLSDGYVSLTRGSVTAYGGELTQPCYFLTVDSTIVLDTEHGHVVVEVLDES